MSEVGRPTELTEELTLKIRKLVLDGLKYTEIRQILDISADTWDGWVWRDYKGFRKSLVDWDKEIIVDSAKANLHVLLGSEDERVKADMTKFALDRLDKDFKSKTETDITTGGKPLTNSLKELSNEELGAIIAASQSGTGKEGVGE